MLKWELTVVTPLSFRIFRRSGPEYLARPPKPSVAYPTGEQSSTDLNPASLNILIVPGKSLAIIRRTGHVWQPMGRPNGSARRLRAPAARAPDTTAFAEVFFKNSLLEIADIRSS